MTAVNIAIQKRSVHVMTDGLSYDKDGTIVEVSPKCWALPSLHGAVACMGPCLAGIVTAAEFTKRFASFDGMIADLEEAMPRIFTANLSLFSGSGIPDLRVYIAGWSESRDRPEAYSIQCIPPESLEYWRAKNEEQISKYGVNAVVSDEPFKLVPLDDVICNPPFADGLTAQRCGFCVPRKGGLADALDPAVDMVVMLQMQRMRVTSLRPGLSASSKVGGHALLTTVDRRGVHQRVVHRWPNDKIGQPIEVESVVDWKRLRTELRAA